jgi:hypothetical protein
MDGTSRPLIVTLNAAPTNFTVWYGVFAGVDQTLAINTATGVNNTASSGPALLSPSLTISSAGDQAIYISNIQNSVNTTAPTYSVNANWTPIKGTNTGAGGGQPYQTDVTNRNVTTAGSDNATTGALAPANDERWSMSAISLPKAIPIYTSVGAGGNWNTPATWDLNAVPPAGSNVVIANGAPVTVDVNTASLNNLTINSTLSTGTFTVSGTGTLTLASTGTLQVGGANNFPSGFTTNTLNSGSTVEYNGSVAQTVATQSYSNLKINNASGASLAAATTATGLLTMSNGYTGHDQWEPHSWIANRVK